MKALTPEVVADLEAKATAAESDAPGPWDWREPTDPDTTEWGLFCAAEDHERSGEDLLVTRDDGWGPLRTVAAHIAAASPDRVLALCAAWRAQRGLVAPARELAAAADDYLQGVVSERPTLGAEIDRMERAIYATQEALRALDGAAGTGEAG